MDERSGKARRFFAGIALEGAARSACARAAERLRGCGFDAKYEDASKFHMTLAFLGNVEASRFDEITRAFESCARGAPFTLALDRLGAFPHERKPRIVYVGAREQGAAFRTLARLVRAAYEKIGFTFDGDPVAHVTIARVKHAQRALPPVDFEPFELEARELSLFETIFDPNVNASHYDIIRTVSLTMTGSA